MRQRGSEGGLVISWWRLYLPKTEESTQPIGVLLFVVFGLAMRRARKNVQYGEDGSRFIIYTNISGAGTGNADHMRRDDPDTYELSPDEYTVEAAPSKKPGDTDPKAIGDHGKS